MSSKNGPDVIPVASTIEAAIDQLPDDPLFVFKQNERSFISQDDRPFNQFNWLAGRLSSRKVRHDNLFVSLAIGLREGLDAQIDIPAMQPRHFVEEEHVWINFWPTAFRRSEGAAYAHLGSRARFGDTTGEGETVTGQELRWSLELLTGVAAQQAIETVWGPDIYPDIHDKDVSLDELLARHAQVIFPRPRYDELYEGDAPNIPLMKAHKASSWR